MNEKKHNLVLTDNSLTQFFYNDLSKVNKNSICPIPEEFILYSSEVLDKYALSEKFYHINEQGVLNEKILGLSFLEAENKSLSEKKSIYKDIGDSILVQMGFFHERIQVKNPAPSYYLNLGKTAYSNAQKLDCRFYDIPNFYQMLATSLEHIIKLLKIMKNSHKFDSFQQYLLEDSEDHSNLFMTKPDLKVS